MLVVISTGKKAIETSSSFTAQSECPVSKKWAILATIAVLVACLLLIAILIGMFMYIGNAESLMKQIVQLEDDTRVEQQVYLKENVVQYHVKQSDYEEWIVDDLNTYIEVVKVIKDAETNCYVYPINDTARIDMNKINRPLSTNNTHLQELYFIASNSSIPNTSFLSKAARDMCKGIPIKWVYPKCTDEELSRVKRRCRWCWGFFVILVVVTITF